MIKWKQGQVVIEVTARWQAAGSGSRPCCALIGWIWETDHVILVGLVPMASLCQGGEIIGGTARQTAIMLTFAGLHLF